MKILELYKVCRKLKFTGEESLPNRFAQTFLLYLELTV